MSKFLFINKYRKSAFKHNKPVRKITSSNSITRSIAHAILILHNEHVIAYPTEAIFGIGCDPDSETAVSRLLKLKQRPVEKGLILIAACYEQLSSYIDDSMLTQVQRNKILSMWPGPVTFIFPALSTTPRWLTGHFNSLAVRITRHPIVINLCKLFGKPLVSTSANLTGLPPCNTVNEVRKQFGDTISVVIGETSGYRNPSKIYDILTGKRLR